MDHSEMASMDADSDRVTEKADVVNAEDVKARVKEEGKGHSESEGRFDSAKAGDDDEFKGLGEEMDDREDGAQNDEQLADMLDTETDRQEGGVRYYRASYEMPLCKINPSILQVSQKLFGKGTLWSHGRSLCMRRPKRFPDNPIHAAVSLLLSSKAT